MFERMKGYGNILVTGPHRSGTTIAAEMIAHDTGMALVREEAFNFRNIKLAQRMMLERPGAVYQGPYLLPWAPILPCYVVYVYRPHREIEASLARCRARGVSMPHFDAAQAAELWDYIEPHVTGEVIDYYSLAAHPLFRQNRKGWHHRRTQ